MSVQENKNTARMTTFMMVTVVLLFIVLLLLGFLMRAMQGDLVDLPAGFFYAMMTLHGLGMVGVLFVGGIMGTWYLISKYVDVSIGLLKFNFVLVVLGVLGLVVATLIGGFGPGWYMLYPLPFFGEWANWSIGAATISLILLGVSWLLWLLDILRAIISRYGVKGFLAWKYLGGANNSDDEVPPIIVIASVSAIAGAVTTVFGAVLLMLFLIQWIAPDVSFDALLLKNIVFLFGHTIVNITMYFGLGFVYELLPKYTGRPWKMNKIVAISWNAALIFVIVAYFHHLYMDFAQPVILQYIGQIASYLSTVPATVVTIFGAIGLFYKSGVKWTFVPLALGLSLMGWIIGGFIAVVDSTIVVNSLMHNTLWVTSHFHTYFLLGFVLMLFAFIYDYFEMDKEKAAKFTLTSLLIGGYGVIAMFAIAGVKSVPRRIADSSALPYDGLASAAQNTAMYGSFFGLLLIVGIVVFFAVMLGSLKKKW
ncbi:MAG: cbb3-type cytochrome c oxidase subunit I [Leptospirales bacterium]